MVDVVSPVQFNSQHTLERVASANHSASSSRSSLIEHEDENDTITAKRVVFRGKEPSLDELHILAASAQITEISFSISDIQTRIFEIQELRHKSSIGTSEKVVSLDTSSQSASSESSSIIDQALINLDERLEAVSHSIEAVGESLGPLLRPVKTPTQTSSDDMGDAEKNILRKHASLLSDWEAVQTEAEVLREELKEDKWLTVFRSVSEQADGMMKSLEKAVTQCQDFIFQVNKRRQAEATQPTTSLSQESPINLEVFTNIHNAFESKKKYYMPSVTKILSVVDKGMRDRQTKNGECLRMNAEMRQRWRNLRERINRIDTEMEGVRRMLIDRLETESSTSRVSKSGNGFLDTPSPPRSRAPSTASTLSRSISPFRKFAARLTAPGRNTPSRNGTVRLPSTEPVPTLRERASIFFRSGHKATSSMSEASPTPPPRKVESAKKQRWNSSTRIVSNETDATIKATPPKRPSAAHAFSTSPSMSGRVTPSSQASSRPWSPSNSTLSTPSTHFSPPPSISRPSSRATSSFGGLSNIISPRPRPQTPSHIPAPSSQLLGRSSSRMSDWSDSERPPTSLMQRTLSPTNSTPPKSPNTQPRSTTPRASLIPTPRSTPGSQIPVPRVSISRPGSSLSNHSGIPGLPRAQTPESSIRARAQQMPFYQSTTATRSRPLLSKSGPPSSFRDTSGTATPTSAMRSRPSSRSGVFTPTADQNPVPVYIPGNMKDPLDVEVSKVVNSIAHGMLVERVDPPLRGAPKPGEELKAQYAFANALARKVLNCRLVIISRSSTKGGETRKVMCRVGGGWQDLSMYLLSRAAGTAPA